MPRTVNRLWLVIRLMVFRPHITKMVDWALKTNCQPTWPFNCLCMYIPYTMSLYLHAHIAGQQTSKSRGNLGVTCNRQNFSCQNKVFSCSSHVFFYVIFWWSSCTFHLSHCCSYCFCNLSDCFHFFVFKYPHPPPPPHYFLLPISELVCEGEIICLAILFVSVSLTCISNMGTTTWRLNGNQLERWSYDIIVKILLNFMSLVIIGIYTIYLFVNSWCLWGKEGWLIIVN